jgi:hypothetical protein
MQLGPVMQLGPGYPWMNPGFGYPEMQLGPGYPGMQLGACAAPRCVRATSCRPAYLRAGVMAQRHHSAQYEGA